MGLATPSALAISTKLNTSSPPPSPILSSPSIPDSEKTEYVVTTIGNVVADEVRSMRHLTRASKRRSALIFDSAPMAMVDLFEKEDLRSKLRDALDALVEKERDLTLAAEIGSQLVAANTSLLTEYQELAIRNKSLQQQVSLQQLSTTSSAIRSSPRTAYRSLARSRSKNSLTSAESDPSSSPSSTDGSQRVPRRRSIGTIEYINNLERANTDLRAQLDVLEANLRDAERMHRQNMTNLRRTNAGLQDQLRATLQDLRDAEASHARTVSNLERDLDQLRNDLQATALTAAELEDDKRRLLREHAEVRRDTRNLEQNDDKIIEQLNKRVIELEGDNAKLLLRHRDVERRSSMQRVELEELGKHAEELESRAENADLLRQENSRLQIVIEETRQQLEDLRAREIERFEREMASLSVNREDDTLLMESLPPPSLMIAEPSTHLAVRTTAEKNREWEWTKWIERTSQRCWEIDIAGLKNEIADLREHRSQAYLRVKNTVELCTHEVIERTPRPISSLANFATSIINKVTPTPVVNLATSVARGMQVGIERKLLGVSTE
ncbi:hypothetical protein DFS34DRAFT_465092 [Phlyctochytrium arcticum]|nr:hypothetical protein DFS34DRAFT_465092 [Phlyctochytrium arcticum]